MHKKWAKIFPQKSAYICMIVWSLPEMGASSTQGRNVALKTPWWLMIFWKKKPMALLTMAFPLPKTKIEPEGSVLGRKTILAFILGPSVRPIFRSTGLVSFQVGTSTNKTTNQAMNY